MLKRATPEETIAQEDDIRICQQTCVALGEILGYPALHYHEEPNYIKFIKLFARHTWLPKAVILELPRVAESNAIIDTKESPPLMNDFPYWNEILAFRDQHRLTDVIRPSMRTYPTSDMVRISEAELFFGSGNVNMAEKTETLRNNAKELQNLMQGILLKADPLDVAEKLIRAKRFLLEDLKEVANDKMNPSEIKADIADILNCKKFAKKLVLPTSMQELIDRLADAETNTTNDANTTTASKHLNNLVRLIPALTPYVNGRRTAAPDIRASATPIYVVAEGFSSPKA
jgi:hypothetical protein